MKIFDYLRNIYSGEKSLSNHISLFLLCGIMTLCLNQKVSSVLSNLTGGFWGYPSRNEFFIYGCFVAGIVLMIYLAGYLYENVSNFFDGRHEMCDVTLSAFIAFVKMLPLFLLWGLFYTVLAAVGFTAFDTDSLLFYIYFAIIFCLPPFISIIYVLYAQNFEYKIEFFHPAFLFTVIKKCLGDIIYLFFEIIILSVIPVIILYFIFKSSLFIQSTHLQLIVRLAGLCIIVYLCNVFSLVYFMRLIDIAKDKFGSN